jgi:ubiquinone/menaquinone biosynthesis C-methylase UbiE
VFKVNYDDVAATYDQRYAGGAPRELVDFVRTFCSEYGAGGILEVGCGTGQWLKDIHQGPIVGVDVSAAMLERARERAPRACLIRGRAEELPLRSGVVTGLLCINAVHHFQRPRAFMCEAWRVLDAGGALAIVALAPHDGLDRWYIYDYFAGTRETDRLRYPRTSELTEWMEDAGFEGIDTRVAARIQRNLFRDAVFADPVLSRRGTSQLALLSDDAFERGMRSVRAALDSTEDDAGPWFGVDLRLFGMTGRKPSA